MTGADPTNNLHYYPAPASRVAGAANPAGTP